MALHDTPKPLGTLLAGAAAATLILIVVGLHVQAAAFSEDQDALARRARSDEAVEAALGDAQRHVAQHWLSIGLRDVLETNHDATGSGCRSF